ncbi:MAG: hypothetical protein WCP65_03355 [Bacteroidota bacterium]
MNFLITLLRTDPKNYSRRVKVLIFCIMMFSINLFPIWLAVISFDRGSENLQDLNHVKGVLKGSRLMKHKHESRSRTYFEDVLVLKIDSCEDEIGFMEFDEIYPILSKIVKSDDQLLFEIYYDKKRQRIEQDVTLHTFDMKINEKQYVSIYEVKKSEYIGALICSIIALLIFVFTYWGAKKIIRQGIIA